MDNFTYYQFVDEINKIPNFKITLSDILNTQIAGINRDELLKINTDINRDELLAISTEINRDELLALSTDDNQIVPTPEPVLVPTPEPVLVHTPEPVLVPTPEPVLVPKPEPTLKPILQPTKKGGFIQRQYKTGRYIGTLLNLPKLLSRPMKQLGGSQNISIDKIIKIVYNDSKLIGKIVKYYYDTQNNKILDGDELLDICITLLYAEFINKPITSENELLEAINPNYIQKIPELVKSISRDKIQRDINPEIIHTINLNIIYIKNTITSDNEQKGGKDKSTVEEEINLKIKRLSSYLKKKSKHIHRKEKLATLRYYTV